MKTRLKVLQTLVFCILNWTPTTSHPTSLSCPRPDKLGWCCSNTVSLLWSVWSLLMKRFIIQGAPLKSAPLPFPSLWLPWSHGETRRQVEKFNHHELWVTMSHECSRERQPTRCHVYTENNVWKQLKSLQSQLAVSEMWGCNSQFKKENQTVG